MEDSKVAASNSSPIDELLGDELEIRQLNTRIPGSVYQVLKFLANRHEQSVAKLAETVLTEYAETYLEDAQDEARAAVAAALRAVEALDRLASRKPEDPPATVATRATTSRQQKAS